MADVKISQLPVATAVSATDVGPIVHAGITVKATGAQVVTSALDATPVTSTQGGTGQSTYTLGDTLYASATNTLSKLAGNTTATKKFLSQTGSGSASTAPSWEVLDPSDINTQYGAFHYDYTTSLSATINQNVQIIPVVSTTGFSATGAIIIENEVITYTGITATSFTGCTRGAAGTSNTTHNSGVGVGGAQTTAANTSTLLQINTVDLSNGVTLNLATSELSVAINGTYNIQYSAQLFNGTINQDLVSIWYDLDGTPVPSSASWGTIPARKNSNTPGSNIMTVNLFLNLTTSNKLTLRWLSVDGTGVIATYPSSVSPLYPSAPALIVTVNQVS